MSSEPRLQELQRKHEWAERMRRNAIIALESAVEARDYWDREAARIAAMIAVCDSHSAVSETERNLCMPDESQTRDPGTDGDCWRGGEVVT